MGIKQETKMLKRSNGEKAVSVNDIVNGLESCKISNNTSKDSGLNELLKNMKIDDGKVIEKPSERKPLPREDDERGVIGLVCDLTVTPDNLVKLEAPSVDDKEEDEEDNYSPNEEAEPVLEERGPMHGVPANYKVEMEYNHIASKPYTPYQPQNDFTGDSCHPAMPSNFLDYGYQNTKSTQKKRGMDERETYYEPYKYGRPHTGVEVTNDLSSPCYAANSAMGNGKTVIQVYQKQMSGGTVHTSDGSPAQNEHFLHGTLDSQELQDLIHIGSEVADFNIPVNTDDFLQTREPPSPNVIDTFEQILGGERIQMINEMAVGFHQQPWNVSLGPPHVAQFTDAFNHGYQTQQFKDYQQAQQFEDCKQPYQVGVHKKRGSFGNDDGSDGYASDLSPSHDPQMSPTPSPRSVMDSSPATMNGSPPRTNWSPPPSNMSYCSADSGVGSPMTDELSGYSSQKSPRQGYVMSPQSVPSVPLASYHSRSSPLTTPPACLPAPKVHQVASAGIENYTSSYIDTHLQGLDDALEIASKDLMSEKLKKGYLSTPLQTISMPGLNNDSNVMNNMSNIFSEKVLMAHQNYQMVMKAASGYTNSAMDGKMQQSIANLPTTVPATIQLGNKIMVNGQQATSRISQSDLGRNINGYQPISNVNLQPISIGSIQPIDSGNIQQMVGTVGQQWQPPTNSGGSQINIKSAALNNCIPRNTVQVTQPAGAAPFIMNPPTTSSMQISANNQGKIPIAPINHKPKLPGQSQMFIMATNGTVTPVFIMPQNNPAKTPQKALKPLLPKAPPKQNEKTADTNTKPSSCGNSPTSCSSPNQGDRSPGVPAPNGKKAGGASVDKLLNLARRLVAEMLTVDLKYRDDDGDTYLHVAVCRADKFMVQALLERLVREGLSEMIDKQNLQGQTPLYLAVSTNNAEMVQLLIEQGADVNPFAESETSTGSIEKTAAIHCASTKGEKHLDTLLALLKAPEININQVNSEGHTALNCAILAHGRRNADQSLVNSIPIIRALLQAHADPNLQVQQSGKTALMYALESRDLDLIESTFQLVEPQKLPTFLKTQAFDSSSCVKIAESLKATLDPTGQQRLLNCLKSGSHRGVW